MNGDASRRLDALRVLARVMDDAVRIPGTRVRVGLDALLGLLPGVGDAATAIVAAYALIAAARLGAPPSVIARMGGNVIVDAVVGAVPVLGDLFDIGWKANRRNVLLLERYLADPGRTTRGSRVYVGIVLAGLILLLILLVAGVIGVATWILGQF